MAYKKPGQTYPTLYSAQAGDGSFWSDAFQALRMADNFPEGSLGIVRRQNKPSDRVEVWRSQFSNDRRSPA